MDKAGLLWGMIILPAAAAGVCLMIRGQRAILVWICVAVAGMLAMGSGAAGIVFTTGPMMAANGWLYLDALSAYHLVLLQLVFLLSSVYARYYFAHEIESDDLTIAQTRRFGALWLGSLGSMVLVLISNNLGMVWVGIEATTLLTAFLICIHVSTVSLEAMWKYLIMCSVGVAFAFVGTLLIAAAGSKLHLGGSEFLLWTHLRTVAADLDPSLVKMGFIFLLVGYGTKAGIAPMHSWLPDAHSQAPAPVSAVFSGFLLNAGLYCIMRYIPLVETATGNSNWGLHLLRLLGLFSIVVAGAFIVFQRDAKRLLAYSSVEHMGIIALGLGLGGLGTFAAMFHVMNHSICKSLGFFSAGRLGQMYGSHDLHQIKGVLRQTPIWGSGFFVSLLALIGVAPFAIFMSEFQILKASVDCGAFWATAIFLAGTAVVFIGALQHAIAAAWDDPARQPAAEKNRLVEKAVVFCPLALLLILGIWMPDFLRLILDQAARVIGGGI